MILVGIDYSRISPAITIYKNGEFFFHSIQREGNIKEKYIESLNLSGIEVTVIDKIGEHKDESQMESIYSYDADYQARITAEAIKDYVDDEVEIALEGLSFSSQGSSSLTYAGYHFILRRTLSEVLSIPYEKINIISPGTIKKTAGKGNYKKEQMIDAFIHDEFFKETKFWQDINASPELFQSPKAHNWQKPLDDLVDSAYACKWLVKKQIINENIRRSNK